MFGLIFELIVFIVIIRAVLEEPAAETAEFSGFHSAPCGKPACGYTL